MQNARNLFRSLLAMALVTLLAAAAFAQDEGDSHAGQLKGTKKTTTTNTKILTAVVTQADAAQVFAKLEKIMREVLTDMPATKPAASLPKGTTPVTRTAVVKQFDRLFGMAKPVFRITPPLQKYDSKVLQMKDSAAKASLGKLIAWGFVAKIGPLATGPKDQLTVEEFGDAIGYFIARLAELTHTPSAKFSPNLNGEGD